MLFQSHRVPGIAELHATIRKGLVEGVGEVVELLHFRGFGGRHARLPIRITWSFFKPLLRQDDACFFARAVVLATVVLQSCVCELVLSVINDDRLATQGEQHVKIGTHSHHFGIASRLFLHHYRVYIVHDEWTWCLRVLAGVVGDGGENGRAHGVFKFSVWRQGYLLIDHGTSLDVSPFTTPVLVALSVSRSIVDRLEDEERLVSNTLIKLFESEKHQPIKLALESVETNYQTRDACGMMSSLITATELICKLIPELENERKISKCLKQLFDDEKLLEKYKINQEIVWALNNARIIRNEEIVHLKQGHTGTVSMYEAVGYAHLLLLFTNSLLASGVPTQQK